MGAVLLGSMVGLAAAVVALGLGTGFWPALMTYTVTGIMTTCGVMVAVLMRPAPAEEFGKHAPKSDTMQQWLEDAETQLNDQDQSNAA